MRDVGKLVALLLSLTGILLKIASKISLFLFKTGFRTGKFVTVSLYMGWQRK